MSIAIEFSRHSRIFSPFEKVSGKVVIKDMGNASHNGIAISGEGFMLYGRKKKSSSSSSKSKSKVPPESDVKTIPILKKEKKIAEAAKFQPGENVFYFEFKLSALEGAMLLESYKGVYVVCDYELTATSIKTMMGKALIKKEKFYLNIPGFGFDKVWGKEVRPIDFEVTSEGMESSALATIPKFLIKGHLDNVNACIDEPLTGSFYLKESELDIQSIEIQLVRAESYKTDTTNLSQGTEVQNIQLTDGNVLPNLEIPIFMIFPRYFSCASFAFGTVSVNSLNN